VSVKLFWQPFECLLCYNRCDCVILINKLIDLLFIIMNACTERWHRPIQFAAVLRMAASPLPLTKYLWFPPDVPYILQWAGRCHPIAPISGGSGLCRCAVKKLLTHSLSLGSHLNLGSLVQPESKAKAMRTCEEK